MLAQILHALPDVLLADEVEDGRLLHLDGECLSKCGVEDGIAGLVLEVGEDDGVFGGGCDRFRYQLLGFVVLPKLKAAKAEQGKDKKRCDRDTDKTAAL